MSNKSKNIAIALLSLTSCLTYACRTPSAKIKRSVSTANISGVIAPGKGFDIRSRELTENICVVAQDASTQSNSADSSTSSSLDGSGSSTNLTDPFSLNGDTAVTGNTSFKVNFDAPKTKTVMALAGDQSGGSQIDLYYAHTLKDLMLSLDATIQFEMGGSRGGGDIQNIDSEFLPAQSPSGGMNLTDEGTAANSSEESLASGSIVSKFRAQLQAQYKSATNKTFILLHGIKTFPTLPADTVSNPKFNPLFTNAIFGGKNPSNEEEAATTYNEFRKYCGDYYVESIVRGREVWLVAVMESSQFNSLYQASGDLTQGSHVKAENVGELKNNIKSHVGAQNSNSFLSQKVEIKVASRGKINMNMGNFTFEDALDKFNLFLNSIDASSSGMEEGALEVSLRPYDNVRFNLGTNEQRLGNVFTTAIKNRSAQDVNVLTKLVQESAWADKEYKIIIGKYRWGQWSLDNNIHNGVANQAQSLLNYRKSITEVLNYCGQISDEKNASEECLAKAQEVAKQQRPTLNLPKPYDNIIEFYFPDALISSVRAGKKIDSLVVTQADARTACSKITTGHWVLPNAYDWGRIVETSYFYSKWNSTVPGYRASLDANPLALPCGSFNSMTFWIDEPGRTVQVNPNCQNATATYGNAPKSFQYSTWLGFGTPALKGAYACVRYRPLVN